MDSEEEALTALERALAFAPDHPELKVEVASGHAQCGLAYLNKGDFAQAVDHLERANALYPNNDSVRQNLLVALVQNGETSFQRGQGAEAEAAMERALALAPDHAAVKTIAACHFHRHANVLAEGGDHQGALVKIERAVAIAPDIDEAIPYFESILSLAVRQHCPDQAFIDRVLTLFRMAAHNVDRIDDLIAFLKALLLGSGDPDEMSVWCTIVGRELMRSDGFFHYHYCADATGFLGQALALAPTNAEARRYLGMCLIRLNSLAGAAQQFKLSLALNPAQLDPFFSSEAGLGLAYHHLGETALATQSYLYLLKRFERLPAAYDYVRIEASRLLNWTIQQPAVADEAFHSRLSSYADNKRAWNATPQSRRKTVRILCFGKCNGQAIGEFLDAALKPHVDVRIIPVWSEEPYRTKRDILKYVGQCDVVITQDFAIGGSNSVLIENQNLLAAELAKHNGIVKISFPYIDNSAFWSISIRAGDQMPVTSKSVKELLESSTDIEEVLRAYDVGALDFDFKRRYKAAMSDLKFLERSTDIKVHDYIQANMKTKLVFLDPNHPARDLWIDITRQVCRILSDKNIISAEQSDLISLSSWSKETPYEGVGNPIDQYSQNHYGFDWCQGLDSPHLTDYYHRMLRYAKSRLAG